MPVAVLFTGPRERKGFLSEAKRFGDSEHTDLPGRHRGGGHRYACTPHQDPQMHAGCAMRRCLRLSAHVLIAQAGRSTHACIAAGPRACLRAPHLPCRQAGTSAD